MVVRFIFIVILAEVQRLADPDRGADTTSSALDRAEDVAVVRLIKLMQAMSRVNKAMAEKR